MTKALTARTEQERADLAVTELCDAVMRGVAAKASGRISDVDTACEIMRREVKAAMLDRGRDGVYERAREAVAAGSLHGGYFVALIVGECLGAMIDAGIVRGVKVGYSMPPDERAHYLTEC